MTSDQKRLPLACIEDAIPAADRQRHFDLARHLFLATVIARESRPDGYAFRFPIEALEQLERFISNERKCCPFLAFQMHSTGSEAWLDITGPEGTREFLEAQLTQ